MFSALTGWKLDVDYLLSVSLSKGETYAAFASFEHFPFNMLLFIALNNGVLKISADNWINLGGILSILLFEKTFSNVLRKQKLESYIVYVDPILLSSS